MSGLKEKIERHLEWANKRLKLQGKELDETQIEILQFAIVSGFTCLTDKQFSEDIEEAIRDGEMVSYGPEGAYDYFSQEIALDNVMGAINDRLSGTNE